MAFVLVEMCVPDGIQLFNSGPAVRPGRAGIERGLRSVGGDDVPPAWVWVLLHHVGFSTDIWPLAAVHTGVHRTWETG
jgi:hypothetical protein